MKNSTTSSATQNLPKRPLTTFDIENYAKKFKIPYFRGTFSRDLLPKKIRKNESGIINMDDDVGPGTHWVAYKKNGNVVNYFDSFGDLQPPQEAEKYFRTGGNECQILYNHTRYQNFNQYNCGHLCL